MIMVVPVAALFIVTSDHQCLLVVRVFVRRRRPLCYWLFWGVLVVVVVVLVLVLVVVVL